MDSKNVFEEAEKLRLMSKEQNGLIVEEIRSSSNKRICEVDSIEQVNKYTIS